MLKIYLINTLISVIAFVVMKIFRSKSANTYFLLMLTIPGIGAIFALTLFICKKLIKTDKGEEVLQREEEYDNSISLLIRQAELKNKKELIPVEDALALNDEHIKRNLVIDALKNETYDYLGFLMKALKDEDTETSHYAATAVTEMKRKLTIALQKIESEYEKNNYDQDIAKKYLEILTKCIDSKLLDDRTQTRLIYKYKEVLEKLISKYGYSEDNLNEIIKICNRLGEYDKSKFYCNKYMENFPLSEKPYMFLLEVYYNLRDKISFDKTIKSIRESDIKLDNESLQTLRFWIEGE